MPFVKGQPPGPGRPRNPLPIDWRRTREICEEIGFHPAIEAIKRYMDESLPQDIRQSSLAMVYDRCEPRYKAIEHRVADDSQQNQVVINILAAQPGQVSIQPGVEHHTTVLPTIEAASPAEVNNEDDE